MSKKYNKSEVIQIFNDWIQEFPNNHEFELIKGWDTALCISGGKNTYSFNFKGLSKKRISKSGFESNVDKEKIALAKIEYDLDIKHGILRDQNLNDNDIKLDKIIKEHKLKGDVKNVEC